MLDIGGGTATGSISASSALSLRGAKVNYTSTSGNNQTFNGVTLNGGPSVIANPVSTAGHTLSLNTLLQTAGTGATVKFMTNGLISTSTADQNGAIGGWAVIDNGDGTYSWADSGPGGVYNITPAITTSTLGANANWWPSGGVQTVASSIGINSLIETNDVHIASG